MVNRLVRYFKSKLKGLKNHFLWSKDFKKIIRENRSFSNFNNNSFLYNKILIIVPHADDELIGCFKILANYSKNVRLFYCDMSGSNQSINNKITRLNEFVEVANFFKVNYSVAKYDIEEDLLFEVTDYQPDLVLLPNFIDWHHEHRKVNHLFYKVVEANGIRVRNVGSYKISTPISINQISIVFEVNKNDLKRKKEIFLRHYKSQRNMPLSRFFYEDRVYGRITGFYAGEVYSIYDFESWKKRVDVLSRKEYINEISNLDQLINNIWMKWKSIESIEAHLKEDIYE